MRFDKNVLLAPDQRALYSDSLRPPIGHVFDGGLATTFSLDLEALLTVPVYLALASVPDARDALANPIAILEAIERTSQKLAIFVQGGRMHAVDKQPRLCALLESVTIEVNAPRGGSFHPKLWLLRFRPQNNSNGTPLLRLLVLSRNLTNDRSWDFVLRLEGKPGRRNVVANNPLAKLVAALPELANRTDQITSSTRELVLGLADQALCTAWELPDGFDELSFETIGLSRRTWWLPHSHRLAVVSPFCDDSALEALADATPEPALLLSRPETLETISAPTRVRFGRVCVLDDAAETEDGEEGDQSDRRLYGLHAKVYLLDRGWNTTLIVGSGNATRRVFKTGDNVELFALLTGRRSKIGNVGTLLSTEGLGAILTDFVEPMERTPEISQAELQAEKDLEAARAVLTQAGLTLNCLTERTPPKGKAMVGPQGGLWRVTLTTSKPVALAGIRRISVWSVTSRKEQARDGLPLTIKGTVHLGAYSLADVCGFIAFELEADAADRSITFSLNVPVIGLPSHRDRAILRSVIEGADGFLRYLRLLLADLGGFQSPPILNDGGKLRHWSIGGDASDALLEDLVRALSREPDRVRAVDRLIERLDEPDAENPVVPADFLALWGAFRALIPTPEARDEPRV
jgi:hypothetical protein